MASVSFKNVEKAFGGTKVIRGIGFDIADGEFVVLVGPSGCGKSTLLCMLALCKPEDLGYLVGCLAADAERA